MPTYITPQGNMTYTFDSRFLNFMLAGPNRVQVSHGIYSPGGSPRYHYGIDIDTTDGDWRVHSTVAGKVIMSTIVTNKDDLTWQWGHFVCILDNVGYRHYFCHLASRAVSVGTVVKAGDVIGIMGKTGNAVGDAQAEHVHYEVRRSPYSSGTTSVDPTPWCGMLNKQGYVNNIMEDTEVLKMSTKPVAMKIGPMSSGDMATVSTLLANLKISHTGAVGGYLETVQISVGDQNTVLQKLESLKLGYEPLCTGEDAALQTKLRQTQEALADSEAEQARQKIRADAAEKVIAGAKTVRILEG